MLRNLILSCIAVLVVNIAFGQDLKFNRGGKFKIVQFTDLHYNYGEEPSKKTLKTINYTLDIEKPDLVVFTGDVITGKTRKLGWDEVLQTVIERKIPYLVTLGNHDHEGDMTRDEIADYVVSKPGILNSSARIKDVYGVLNEAVIINGNKPAVIYAMDSNAYSTLEHIKGYGWFDYSQVNWYTETSRKLKQKLNDTNLTALAFFHIPLPEYKLAFDNIKNKRTGVRYENECAPDINTGMFAAMLQSGDVLGTFVGHDHVNDYLVDYQGIALAYGCWTGSENTYQRHKNGARIIELTEGKRQFYTYLRESDGTILYATMYPFSK